MLLEIVTPEGKAFSDDVSGVVLPGASARWASCPTTPRWSPLSTAGELRYTKDGKTHELAIGAGFAEITGDHVNVLTEMAVRDTEIDEAPSRPPSTAPRPASRRTSSPRRSPPWKPPSPTASPSSTSSGNARRSKKEKEHGPPGPCVPVTFKKRTKDPSDVPKVIPPIRPPSLQRATSPGCGSFLFRLFRRLSSQRPSAEWRQKRTATFQVAPATPAIPTIPLTIPPLENNGYSSLSPPTRHPRRFIRK